MWSWDVVLILGTIHLSLKNTSPSRKINLLSFKTIKSTYVKEAVRPFQRFTVFGRHGSYEIVEHFLFSHNENIMTGKIRTRSTWSWNQTDASSSEWSDSTGGRSKVSARIWRSRILVSSRNGDRLRFCFPRFHSHRKPVSILLNSKPVVTVDFMLLN